MILRKFEQRDAIQIAHLLNRYLPFEEENEDTVKAAHGIRFVCESEGELVGYIAGIIMNDSYDEMPYYREELAALHEKAACCRTVYTTHLVVHPHFRGAGIGRKLVDAYMAEVKQQAELLIVVGWVQSDTGLWDAEGLFVRAGLKPFMYINHYFEPYKVYCPNCAAICYCDAHIHYLEMV